jgi:hypothetical protein
MVSADSVDSSDCADYSNVQTAVNVGEIRELLDEECQMLHGRYMWRGGGDQIQPGTAVVGHGAFLFVPTGHSKTAQQLTAGLQGPFTNEHES